MILFAFANVLLIFGWLSPDLTAHRTPCGIRIVDGIKEAKDTFNPRTPLLIRSAINASLLWSRNEMLSGALAESEVQIGTSRSILRAAGQGPEVTTLNEFVISMRASFTESGSKSRPRRYLFDRGLFWRRSPPGSYARALALMPALIPAVDTVHIDGYRLEAKDDAVNTTGLPANVGPRAGQDMYLLLGSNGTGVSFHSHAASVVLLHSGAKHWLLYPPSHPSGTPRHHHPNGTTHWLEMEVPKLAIERRPIQCIQLPGDIIYLPESFYHATINYGETLAFALQPRIASSTRLRTKHLAVELSRAKDFVGAERVLTKAIAQWPADASLVLQLGDVLLAHADSIYENTDTTGVGRRKLHIAAANAYSLALAADHHDNEAAIGLCRSLIEADAALDAEQGCEAAVRLDRWSAPAAFYRGRQLAAIGNFNDAIESFKRAIALDSGTDASSYFYHLANCLMLQSSSAGFNSGSLSDVNAAIEAYEEAMTRMPQNGLVRLELGMALLKSGRRTEGLRRLKEVVIQNPELAEVATQAVALRSEL